MAMLPPRPGRTLFPFGLCLLWLLLPLLLGACGGNDLILATTTSVQDSGLYDVLIPEFEKGTDYNVKPIAVGSGAALELGRMGEADVLLVHDPAAEQEFMAGGYGVDRRLVMYNYFLIVGPPTDPAGVRGTKSAADALKAIAQKKALFVSRGDGSGTHMKELELWQHADLDPTGQSWYQEAGAGMGQTLMIASDKAAYTLTDSGTYLHNKENLALEPLVEDDPLLINPYHVIRVNPDKHAGLNVEGAIAWADFLVSPQGQQLIATFGLEEFGQPLFIPAAGQDEGTLGR